MTRAQRIANIAAQKAAFLHALARPPRAGQPLPSVADAAAAAGVSRRTPYRWRDCDPEFAARWAAVEAQQLSDRIAANVISQQRVAQREARLAELRPAHVAQAAYMRAVLARNRKAGR